MNRKLFLEKREDFAKISAERIAKVNAKRAMVQKILDKPKKK